MVPAIYAVRENSFSSSFVEVASEEGYWLNMWKCWNTELHLLQAFGRIFAFCVCVTQTETNALSRRTRREFQSIRGRSTSLFPYLDSLNLLPLRNPEVFLSVVVRRFWCRKLCETSYHLIFYAGQFRRQKDVRRYIWWNFERTTPTS
jgi:hypothetical protein